MNKTQVHLLIILIFGLGVGFLLGQVKSSDDNSGHDKSSHMSEHGADGHTMHKMFNVEVAEAPSVEVFVTEDDKSGWNISLNTENFEFTPGKVNQDNVIGEGHAHLYVDGMKVARLYGPDFHYDESFDGTKEFKVTLNANDHSEYAVDGEAIESSVSITHNH